MEQWLVRRWYGESAPLALRPLSWLFHGVIALRRALYRRGVLSVRRIGCPVVVVGNLTVGGTGKTPFVIWLAQRLAARGLKVGIVSRGYGRGGHEPRIVGATAHWREVGDEPLLLRRATGCLTAVAADRVAGAELLVEQGVDLVIADDGLQHLRLARDYEIVVVDGARGFGNGWLLPAGPLRESVSRLSTVDTLVVNGQWERGAALRSSIEMRLEPGEICALAGEGKLPVTPGLRVHAVAGIGNPSRFFRDLRALGIEVIEHPFPDHHAFTARDLEFGDDLPVLMTEKDAVKCRAFANPRLWYVPVSARLDEARASELLDHVLRQLNPAVHG
jgi:tetraacyldisaccharide 4'-kinase